MRGLFITGTDTDVGKTHVACEIVRELREAGHRVGAFKPACSGASLDENGVPHWDDIDRLRDALGRDVSDDQLCPQRFLAPLAPPVAARKEGRRVDWESILHGFEAWQKNCDILVIEGAGGLLCPLADDATMAEFAGISLFPLVIVARLGLGTINHTLLTVEVARQRGLRIAGLVFNEPTPTEDILVDSNPVEVAARCDVPILAICRYQTDRVGRVSESLRLDWWTLAGSW
ncbi:MAG: dethiobiotin synthase [Planctomycetaceae bacterium]|nr:dethiobiotin synthase [Planctomycetaceae bacterium]